MNPWDPNLLLLYGTISLYDNVNITYAIYSSYECLCRPNEYSCDSTMFCCKSFNLFYVFYTNVTKLFW